MKWITLRDQGSRPRLVNVAHVTQVLAESAGQYRVFFVTKDQEFAIDEGEFQRLKAAIDQAGFMGPARQA
jgi:hypothetical protein